MHTEAREKGGFMGWVFRDSLIEGDFLILGGPGWVRPTPCASIRHVSYARAIRLWLSACGYPSVAGGWTSDGQGAGGWTSISSRLWLSACG